MCPEDAHNVGSFAWEKLSRPRPDAMQKLTTSGLALIAEGVNPLSRTSVVIHFIDALNETIREGLTAISLLDSLYNDFLKRRLRGETIDLDPEILDKVGQFLVDFKHG